MALALVVLSILAGELAATDGAPYLGRWALTLPAGQGGWRSGRKGVISTRISCGTGECRSVDNVFLGDGKAYVTRNRRSSARRTRVERRSGPDNHVHAGTTGTG